MSKSNTKQTVQLSRENPTAEQFDAFYEKEDPWGTRNGIPELTRIQKMNDEFKNCKFKNGLDIGCGEGHFTSTLHFVEKFTAIDISKVALKRARNYYPNINFIQADLNNLSSIENHRYDFISCFESLYYVTGQAERKRVLAKIKEKGTDNCVFCFSVVTIGENEYRKYFTYEEAISFFNSEFNIIHQFPIKLGAQKVTFFQKAKRKLMAIFLDESIAVKNYLQELKDAKPETAYQTVFVLIKKK